jgi:hypothetical protein
MERCEQDYPNSSYADRLSWAKRKARLFSKQETDRGVIVGVSSEVQDEILEKKYRSTANDST